MYGKILSSPSHAISLKRRINSTIKTMEGQQMYSKVEVHQIRNGFIIGMIPMGSEERHHRYVFTRHPNSEEVKRSPFFYPNLQGFMEASKQDIALDRQTTSSQQRWGLFQTMAMIVPRFFVEKLKLINVHIDADFIDFYRTIVDRIQTTDLNLLLPSWDDSVDLREFLLTRNCSGLNVQLKCVDREKLTLFDEEFISSFIQGKQWCILVISCEMNVIHFEPQSPTIINILCQYYILRLASIVLNENQLLALIQMRMNSTEESNYLISSRIDHQAIDLSSHPQLTIRKHKEVTQIKSAVNFMCEITSNRNRSCDLFELELKFSTEPSFILDSDDSNDSDY